MAFTPIDLAKLLLPRSAQQVLNDALDFLANPPDPALVSVRTANWRTGGPYRTLLYRIALEAGLMYQIIAGFAGSAFLRFARLGWLDWLGEDFFGEPRQGAEFATADLTLTIPAGAGPYGPLQITAQTTGGIQFASIDLETIPAGPTTFTFSARAVLAGSTANVGANTITQLVAPDILGITVTNAAIASGGFDAESDDRYAQRLAAKWGVLSTGSTQAAYIYWALTASKEVQKVRVYSNLNAGVFASEYVTVVLAGNGTIVSGQAVTDVYDYTNPKIPLDDKLVVVSCRVLPLPVTGTAKVFIPYVGAAPANIASSLRDLGIRIPIGSFDAGPVPVAEFNRAVQYDVNQVYDVTLITPAAPVALDYDQILTPTNGMTIVGVTT